MARRDKILVGILFGVTSLAFVWPALSIGGTFAATDLTLIASPYREDAVEQPEFGTGLQSDQVSQLPLVLEFYDSLREGEFQQWEPDQGAGMPLGTAVYNQLFLPWNVALLAVAGPMGPTVASFLAVYLAQLGMFLFARRLGLGVWGSALAAVAYVFSGPVTALHLRIQQVLLLPWTFFAVHGAITERRVRFVVLTALAVALTWLGGFPAGALFVLYAATAFAIYLIARAVLDDGVGSRMRELWARAWPVSVAALAGTLIAAVQLLPSYSFIQEAESLERGFPIWHRAGLVKLATSVSGRFFGTYQNGDWWWPEPGYSNPVEASSTMGAIVLVLLVVVVIGRGIRDNDRSRSIWQFMLPMALLVLIGVYLGGVVLGMFHQLPFLAENSFGRSRFLISFALALAAGYGLSAIVERSGGRAPGAMRAQVGLVLVAVALGIYEGLTIAAQEAQLRYVVGQLVVPLVAGAVALVVLFLVSAPVSVKGLLVVGLLAFELLWGAWGFTPGSPREAFYVRHPSFEILEEDVGERGQYRFTALGLFDVVPPNEAALLDLSDARYFYPVVGEYEDLWQLVDPGLVKRPGDPWIPHIYTDAFDATSPALDRMAVRFLAVPLSKPLQDVASAPVSISDDPETPIALSPNPAGIRGLSIGVTLEPGCDVGWLVLEGEGVTSRRLAREVDDVAVFPLPDLDDGGEFTLYATDCELLSRASDAVLFTPASEALSVVGIEDWVLYERSNSRPRVEMVSQIAQLQSSEIGVLNDPAARSTVFISEDFSISGGEAGTALLVEDTPDRVVIEVEAGSGGLLVLRDAYSDGWHATVDGEPVDVVRVDHAFRGIELASGDHRIVFSYEPDSVRLGLLGALFGFLMVGVAVFVLVRHQARSPEEDSSP